MIYRHVSKREPNYGYSDRHQESVTCRCEYPGEGLYDDPVAGGDGNNQGTSFGNGRPVSYNHNHGGKSSKSSRGRPHQYYYERSKGKGRGQPSYYTGNMGKSKGAKSSKRRALGSKSKGNKGIALSYGNWNDGASSKGSKSSKAFSYWNFGVSGGSSNNNNAMNGDSYNHGTSGRPNYTAVGGSYVLPHYHRDCENVRFLCPDDQVDGPFWESDCSNLVGSSGDHVHTQQQRRPNSISWIRGVYNFRWNETMSIEATRHVAKRAMYLTHSFSRTLAARNWPVNRKLYGTNWKSDKRNDRLWYHENRPVVLLPNDHPRCIEATSSDSVVLSQTPSPVEGCPPIPLPSEEMPDTQEDTKASESLQLDGLDFDMTDLYDNDAASSFFGARTSSVHTRSYSAEKKENPELGRSWYYSGTNGKGKGSHNSRKSGTGSYRTGGTRYSYGGPRGQGSWWNNDYGKGGGGNSLYWYLSGKGAYQPNRPTDKPTNVMKRPPFPPGGPTSPPLSRPSVRCPSVIPSQSPTITQSPTRSSQPSSTPTTTPLPTSSPRPTQTPQPSPAPTITARPTETPGPTKTPQPSQSPTTTPLPTETPRPSQSSEPSRTPTVSPAPSESSEPSSFPTETPRPSRPPTTRRPFQDRTSAPTETMEPSPSPSKVPSTSPSSPTVSPAPSESSEPSSSPTETPRPSRPPTTRRPFQDRTSAPTETMEPSPSPSKVPSTSPSSDLTITLEPSISPSEQTPAPVNGGGPTPTRSPTNPTIRPTRRPFQDRTSAPTETIEPSPSPSKVPSTSPSSDPTRTSAPSASPSSLPSASPAPSTGPTDDPSARPTLSPSTDPTQGPTSEPTTSPSISPTKSPTLLPTTIPSVSPTETRSLNPSAFPSSDPTNEPTETPTSSPSVSPSAPPTASPSRTPTADPTESLSANPTTLPSQNPTNSPSASPSISPSTKPTFAPTKNPTGSPTPLPTDLPLPLLGKVAGVVFEDANGDGLQDEGEPGIEGVSVVITDSLAATQTVTTDENGEYMADVPIGLATTDIDESSLPPGAEQTTGTDPTTLDVPPGGTATDSDGFQFTGKVEGVVFEDVNNNGVQDPGEPGIAGVIVVITDSIGEMSTLITDETGMYMIQVPNGFTVIDIDESTLPPGGEQTVGTDPTTVRVPGGGTASDLDGYYFPTAMPTRAPTESPSALPSLPPSSFPTLSPSSSPTTLPSSSPSVAPTPTPTGMIVGVVFEDINNNGQQDAGEPGIDGIDVVITDSGGNTFTLTTDVTGMYMAEVPIGDTVIDIDESTLPPGYQQTVGTDPTTVNVPSGGSATDLDGYHFPTAAPSDLPSQSPTTAPTASPTLSPSTTPTIEPTLSPTKPPSSSPSTAPSAEPTSSPSAKPSENPSRSPTLAPSDQPRYVYDPCLVLLGL